MNIFHYVPLFRQEVWPQSQGLQLHCTPRTAAAEQTATDTTSQFSAEGSSTGHRSAYYPSPSINKDWTGSNEQKKDLPGLCLSEGNCGCPGKSLRMGHDTPPEHIRQESSL